MNRQVIFLDFDGVLNTEQYQAQLAVDGKPGKDAWGPLFDPRAVANLRKILEATDAGIVISSSWRYLHRLGRLRMMWGCGDCRVKFLIRSHAERNTSREARTSNVGSTEMVVLITL